MDDSAELAEDKPCAELVSVLFVRGWIRQRAGRLQGPMPSSAHYSLFTKLSNLREITDI